MAQVYAGQWISNLANDISIWPMVWPILFQTQSYYAVFIPIGTHL